MQRPPLRQVPVGHFAGYIPNFTNQASFANAMRPPENAPDLQPRRNDPVLVVVALIILAAAALLFAAVVR